MPEVRSWLALTPLVLSIPLIAAEPLFRHRDDRATVNTQLVEKNGIRGYSSKRLILYTDIAPEKAQALVQFVDEVFDDWEHQFGPLPEAQDKSDFQITGYLMKDSERFRAANLLRRDPTNIVHGQNEGYEFWMHDQGTDYYREHLLLHEATHCVTQCREREDAQRPVWFLEGMAEFFGMHQRPPADGGEVSPLKFGGVPISAESSRGFGRIEMIRAECAAGRALSASQVIHMGPRDFAESRTTPYAWSWAFCVFLAHHPSTADDFRKVCHQWETKRFHAEFLRMWQNHIGVIATDWEIFRDSLCYGFDLRHGATIRRDVTPLDGGLPRSVDVQARHGWQSTGVSVAKGQSIRISATGRVTLAETTKPWVSEPAGISVRYSEKKPIGRLTGAIQRQKPLNSGDNGFWEFFDIGTENSLQVPADGTLFLRVNDRWNEIADNSGAYQVTITAHE